MNRFSAVLNVMSYWDRFSVCLCIRLTLRGNYCRKGLPADITQSQKSTIATTLYYINVLCVLSLQGVIEFSLCLLFAKLVSYTFLFWLPLYITKAGEDQTELQPLFLVIFFHFNLFHHRILTNEHHYILDVQHCMTYKVLTKYFSFVLQANY